MVSHTSKALDMLPLHCESPCTQNIARWYVPGLESMVGHCVMQWGCSHLMIQQACMVRVTYLLILFCASLSMSLHRAERTLEGVPYESLCGMNFCVWRCSFAV